MSPLAGQLYCIVIAFPGFYPSLQGSMLQCILTMGLSILYTVLRDR